MKKLTFMLMAILLSGCASRALTGAGREGAVVNDALPEDATIYRAEIDELGEESDRDGHEISSTPFVWNALDQEVPCSAIRGVEYFLRGDNAGEIALRLVGHTYGGRYYPRPGASRYWLSPKLWVDADYDGNETNDFEESEAEFAASHCGVEFHVRN